LYKSKVTAKRKYLEARQVQAKMSIKHKAAKQRLLAIGLTEKSIDAVLGNADEDLTLYELRAPSAG
jgi:cobalt-zinc-cadmium efflux system membrane fusion protein